MSKDYAKKHHKQMKSYNAHGKASRIKWFMIGLLTGTIVCVAFFTLSWEPIIQQFNKILNHSSTKPKMAKKVEKPQPPTPQFDFYSMLPMDEPYNVSAEETKPVSVTPQAVATSSNERKNFILQVASFNKSEESQRLKKQLLQSGFAANIEIFVKERKTWYRVIIGPFNDANEAHKQQQKLKEAHIDSLLLTQKP